MLHSDFRAKVLALATDDLNENVPFPQTQEPSQSPAAESEQGRKGVTDYLLTYGWAMLLVLAILLALYFFLFSKPNSSNCVFYNALYCKGVVFTTNSFRSNVGFFVENHQSKPLAYPKIVVNFSGTSSSGNCTPLFVLQGADMACNVAFSKLSEVPNATVSGAMYINAVPCPGENFSACFGISPANFSGKFTTRVLQSNATASTTISLEANTTSPAANGAKDTIIATVQFLGSPLPDANVTFSQTGTFAGLAPTVTTTDANGRAGTNISSTKAGSTIVTVTFAGESANITINFSAPVSVAVQVAPDINSKVCSQQNSAVPVVTVDGQSYPCSQLPLKIMLASNSQHRFACIAPITGGTGIRYAFSSASACGLAVGQNGTFTTGTGGSSCLLSCDYVQQYYLTETANPSNGGSVAPGSKWINANQSTVISESPSQGYIFLNWVGTGSGSYTGTTTSTFVQLSNPMSEQANFRQGTITTTSTTITSTTSTSTTSTSTTSTSTTTTLTWNLDLQANSRQALVGSPITLTATANQNIPPTDWINFFTVPPSAGSWQASSAASPATQTPSLPAGTYTIQADVGPQGDTSCSASSLVCSSTVSVQWVTATTTSTTSTSTTSTSTTSTTSVSTIPPQQLFGKGRSTVVTYTTNPKPGDELVAVWSGWTKSSNNPGCGVATTAAILDTQGYLTSVSGFPRQTACGSEPTQGFYYAERTYLWETVVPASGSGPDTANVYTTEYFYGTSLEIYDLGPLRYVGSAQRQYSDGPYGSGTYTTSSSVSFPAGSVLIAGVTSLLGGSCCNNPDNNWIATGSTPLGYEYTVPGSTEASPTKFPIQSASASSAIIVTEAGAAFH